MDEQQASWIAEGWSGGRGLVPRGPKQLLGWCQATPADAERHTGLRPPSGSSVWRIEIGGRFLRSGGLVYPGGVPFPEELQRRTAVVSSEVWLYVDEDTERVLGSYWWPEAVRKPIAATPEADFEGDEIVDPSDAADRFSFPLRIPDVAPLEPAAVVRRSRDEAIVLFVRKTTPDPLNEMLLFAQGGLSLRAERADASPDLDRLVREHQPPFRHLRSGRLRAAGREPGRSLGPQTWPWPGELLWWVGGVSYELKGSVPLARLQEVAAAVQAVP